MFKIFLPKSDSIYWRAKTQPLILLDLGKLIPKVKTKKKTTKNNKNKNKKDVKTTQNPLKEVI